MGGVCSANGEMRNMYKNYVEKPEWKRHLGRVRRRWEIILKRYLGKKIGFMWLKLGIGGGLL
jgi:hypothetical protein